MTPKEYRRLCRAGHFTKERAGVSLRTMRAHAKERLRWRRYLRRKGVPDAVLERLHTIDQLKALAFYLGSHRHLASTVVRYHDEMLTAKIRDAQAQGRSRDAQMHGYAREILRAVRALSRTTR